MVSQEPAAGSATSGKEHLPTMSRHFRLPTPVQRLLRGWWTWELLAAMISLLAVVALVVLFVQSDGRPQPMWAVGNTQVTLNTLVAVLSTVMRSALLVAVAGGLNQSAWNWFAAHTADAAAPSGRPLKDLETFGEAATNSWSSLKLLYRTKGRHIASLGALIVIFSLALDAFVQQVLTTETLPQQAVLSGANLSVENTLPRLQVYDSDVFPESTGDISLEIESVVISSLIQTNDSLPGAICPTGNCTWPVTPTLGICSECSDVKSQVVKNTSTNAVTYTLLWPEDFSPMGDSLLNNLSLTIHSSTFSPVWALGPAISTWDGPSNQPPSDRANLFNFYSLGFLPNDKTATGVIGGQLSDDLLSAYNCTYFFCLQGFSAGSTLGKMHQEPIPTTTDQVVLDGESGLFTFVDIPSGLNVSDSARYQVDYVWSSALGTQLMQILNGSGSLNGETLSTVNWTPSNPIASVFWTASDSLANMTSLSTQLAARLTSHLRTTAAAPLAARYAPTVATLVSFVHVRWAWLAYPLALVLGALLFLVLTMAATRRRRVRPWKGHFMPLLLADVDEEIRAMAKGGLAHCSGLDDHIGDISVRLQFDGEDGLAFRRVDDLEMVRKRLLEMKGAGRSGGTYVQVMQSPNEARSPGVVQDLDG